MSRSKRSSSLRGVRTTSVQMQNDSAGQTGEEGARQGGVSAANDAGWAIYEVRERLEKCSRSSTASTTTTTTTVTTITNNQSIFISVTTCKQNLCNMPGSGLVRFFFCCFSLGDRGYGQLEIFQSHRVRGLQGRRGAPNPIQRQFSLSFAQKAEPAR